MSNENLQQMFVEDSPEQVNELANVDSLSKHVLDLQRLETEIEKALDILNIHPDTIFERETPQYNTLSKYHTAPQYHSDKQNNTLSIF